MSLLKYYIPFVLCFITHAFSSTMKGDSFSSAHTWRNCSFVTKIIQHVEYSVPMARVGELKSLKTPPHTGGTCLRQQSRVRRALSLFYGLTAFLSGKRCCY